MLLQVWCLSDALLSSFVHSCNQISSLDNFSNCKHMHNIKHDIRAVYVCVLLCVFMVTGQQLRQLFLRKNNITSLEEIHHLDQLPNLEVTQFNILQ